MQRKPLHGRRDEPKPHHKTGVHSFSGSKRRFSRKSSGFTLVEMLVVIGISIVLLGIASAGALKLYNAARVEQTQSMMKALLGANEEFKAVGQQGPATTENSPSLNWSTYGGSLSSSERFTVSMKQVATAEKMMLAAVNSGASASNERIYKDSDSDNYNEIFDRWGTELEYRASNSGTGTGPNQVSASSTGGAAISNADLPNWPFPFFVSAGPDETFNTDDDITTIDN